MGLLNCSSLGASSSWALFRLRQRSGALLSAGGLLKKWEHHAVELGVVELQLHELVALLVVRQLVEPADDLVGDHLDVVGRAPAAAALLWGLVSRDLRLHALHTWWRSASGWSCYCRSPRRSSGRSLSKRHIQPDRQTHTH